MLDGATSKGCYWQQVFEKVLGLSKSYQPTDGNLFPAEKVHSIRIGCATEALLLEIVGSFSLDKQKFHVHPIWESAKTKQFVSKLSWLVFHELSESNSGFACHHSLVNSYFSAWLEERDASINSPAGEGFDFEEPVTL